MKLLGTRTEAANKDYSFFEKNKSFFGGKKEKETSLKENKGKDFLFEKNGGGDKQFFIKKAKKFFRNRFLTQT